MEHQLLKYFKTHGPAPPISYKTPQHGRKGTQIETGLAKGWNQEPTEWGKYLDNLTLYSNLQYQVNWGSTSIPHPSREDLQWPDTYHMPSNACDDQEYLSRRIPLGVWTRILIKRKRYYRKIQVSCQGSCNPVIPSQGTTTTEEVPL